MTAVPTVNIVEQFRLALEACENAHAQTSEATPCVAPRTTRVSFPEPLLGLSAGPPASLQPLDASVIPMTTFPGHMQIAQSVPNGVTMDPRNVSTNATVPTASVSTPSRGSIGRLLLYIVLAGVIAGVAMFVRRRYFSPIWKALVANAPAMERETTSEEESVHRIITNQQRRKRARMKESNSTEQSSSEGTTLSEMSAYLRELPVNPQKRGDPLGEPAKCARSVSAKVDLRKVRFQHEEDSAPSQKEVPRAAFFEVEEDDPNFAPL